MSHRRVAYKRHLIGVYLINAHITGVYIMSVYLMGVYLTGVHLMGVYIINVHLTGVHLMGLYLMVVDLSRSELQNSSFCASWWSQLRAVGQELRHCSSRGQENEVESEIDLSLNCVLLIPPYDATCHAFMDETAAASSAIDRHDSRAVNHRAGFETIEWHR
jgi:hypothetical protein